MTQRAREFSYTENRKDSQRRIWVGEYDDPPDAIGIVVGQGNRVAWNSVDIAIPKSSIRHLIDFLQSAIEEEN